MVRSIHYYHLLNIMSTAVYSIRIDERIRKIMEQMPDVDWQAEVKQSVERTVREKKKERMLAEAKELWKLQKNNEIGAAEMIREDRDA